MDTNNLPQQITCREHGKPAKLKVSETFGAQYSHPITWTPTNKTGTWCNKSPEESGVVALPNITPEEPQREPYPQRDYDQENRGKIRTNFLKSHISRNGLVELTPIELTTLHKLVELAMTGK